MRVPAILLLCLAAGVLALPRKVLETDDIEKKHPATDDCEVSEVHISLADDERSYRVGWRTGRVDCGSIVYYGPVSARPAGARVDTSQAGPWLTGVGTEYSLTEGLMCTAPAAKKPFTVTMHVALLRSLTPDTRYWYRIAGSDREFEFTSPPPAGSLRPFSFLAYGDMGEAKHNKKHCSMATSTLRTIQAEMDRDQVDLVVHVGDLAYADGSHKIWDSFMSAIEPIASTIPYMIGVGNHEYDFVGNSDNDPSGVMEPYRPWWGNFGSESGGECGAMTSRRFIMPNVRAATDNAPFWYSYAYGSVHFTMISTEHDMSPGSVQYKWLARDLAAVDRCATPWLVVALHRPMYVVYPHKDNRVVGDHIRDFIEDLLLEYQVDLTLAGHVHTYYRTCDVRDEQCAEDGSGISHFVIGTAGHVLSGSTDEQRDWLDAHVDDYGFVRFDVDNDVMHARFIRSETGEVADQVKLVTRLYTGEQCDDLRASRAMRAAALEARLTALDEPHALRMAEEAKEALRLLTGHGKDHDHDHDSREDDDQKKEQEEEEEEKEQEEEEEEEEREQEDEQRSALRLRTGVSKDHDHDHDHDSGDHDDEEREQEDEEREQEEEQEEEEREQEDEEREQKKEQREQIKQAVA